MELSDEKASVKFLDWTIGNNSSCNGRYKVKEINIRQQCNDQQTHKKVDEKHKKSCEDVYARKMQLPSKAKAKYKKVDTPINSLVSYKNNYINNSDPYLDTVTNLC